MSTSILDTIRHMCVGSDEDKTFDTDLLIYINGTMNTLAQLGLPGADGFVVTGSEQTWEDLLGEGVSAANLEMVKNYVYFNVKQQFDPSSSSVLNSAYDAQIAKLEYRINVQCENSVLNQNGT